METAPRTETADTLHRAPHPCRKGARGINSLAPMGVDLYRFLASLELAVFSLSTLAAVLAYATFFESWYGTRAAQEWIYRSRAFALLLAFLGVNIFCAALIRFRWDGRQKGWTRRQTGFVITHAGLLVVLLGSWITLKTSDEGQVMLLEGDTTDQMIRIDHSRILVEPLDPATGEPVRGEALELPFQPGAFSWDSRENSARSAGPTPISRVPWIWDVRALAASVAALACLASVIVLRSRRHEGRGRRRVAGLVMRASLAICAIFTGLHLGYPGRGVHRDVLTEPGSPIVVIVKEYIAAASLPVWVHDPGAAGAHKVKKTYLPLELPKGQADAGIPACLVELQAGDDRREIWLRRGDDIDVPAYETLVVGGTPYRLAFAFDRRSIGFDLTLADFDVGTDPGTHEASSYSSRVVVNDPGMGVEEKAVTITMNRPMHYRGMTFYQSSFRELRDAETGRKTGVKKSVIQVGIDPFWAIKYLGCLTVVVGTSVQFFMRAGIFTGGGTSQQTRV